MKPEDVQTLRGYLKRSDEVRELVLSRADRLATFAHLRGIGMAQHEAESWLPLFVKLAERGEL